MRIAITGASGLIGTSLSQSLQESGWNVTPVSRRPSNDIAIVWNPSSGQGGLDRLDAYDAVVHFAGESIADGRWTDAKKRRIRESRVDGTRKLSEALASLPRPPKALICASAIGFYGDRGDEQLTESSPPGDSFLAQVCREWEEACEPARRSGIRVVNSRFGIVLSRQGGALAKMLLPFRLGFGGRVGSGRQYWSWIALDDVVSGLRHCLDSAELSGPINFVSPHPVTNLEFTKILGRVLKRPTLIPLPAFAARLALGEMADELLLASARVLPQRLVDSGYGFRYRDLESALSDILHAP